MPSPAQPPRHEQPDPDRPANKTLHEALQHLGKEADFPVNVNASLPETKMPITADLGTLPLKQAVNILAEMAGLGVVNHENFLYVTTAKEADRLRIALK